VSVPPGLSNEYRQLAQSDPEEAYRRFCAALETGDPANCLFPLEVVRIRVFTPLRKMREFAGWVDRWRDLVVQAIQTTEGNRTNRYHRLLFDLALYRNDRETAGLVSQKYLRKFDLATAFPASTSPGETTHDSGEVTPVDLDWRAPLPNRTAGRPRVLLHVDGDGAFLPSVIPGLSCGEALAQMLRQYPFPVTVSFIVREILLDQIEQGGQTWQKILAAFDDPRFEIASHGFIHPMRWQEERFDLDREITGARDFLSKACQRRVTVLLYTGDSVLNHAQLLKVERAGLLGVNGPAEYQRPLVFPVGDWFHFRAAGFSDFQGTEHAQRNITAFESIRRGDLDYPISMHLHHYCQYTPERVNALRRQLQWLEQHADQLEFDTVSNYYGEIRRRLLRRDA